MSDLKISDAAKTAAEEAKSKGFEVEFATIASREFIYRPISRKEWTSLLRKRNEGIIAAGDDQLKQADVMEAEYEQLLGICLVYSSIPVENVPAGAVQTIADAILALSGFGGLDMVPVKL